MCIHKCVCVFVFLLKPKKIIKEECPSYSNIKYTLGSCLSLPRGIFLYWLSGQLINKLNQPNNIGNNFTQNMASACKDKKGDAGVPNHKALIPREFSYGLRDWQL